MCRDYLSVDFQMPIDTVARMAMQRDQDKLYDFITITRDDKYMGLVTIKDLLEKSIQIEITNAKHLNPLSELPGNILIEKHLEAIVSSKERYFVLYFDIDNFKAYNDVYGFEKGDQVIKGLTQILKRNISRSDFIGHIGGDDFIAVVTQLNIEELCQIIIKEFDESIVNYYSERDKSRGYLVTKNRHGIEESYPLLSLSIAGLSGNSYKNIFDLSENASRIKKKCKQKVGSSFIIT